MRVLLLNQYGPPDEAPTARLLGELAEGLRGRGHAVGIVSQGESYRVAHPGRGGSRMRRELGALGAMLRAGWRARVDGQRPDIVLAFSSPPGLLVLAAILARWHGAKLAHWAMDLYPELALALGEIGKGAVHRIVRVLMGWAYRQAGLVVALDEDMRDHLGRSYGLTDVRVLSPWCPPGPAGSLGFNARDSKPEGTTGDVVPWTWLYSGNLGRAHEWETLLDAQARLEARGLPVHLVFQGGGPARGAARAKAEARGLRQCHWRDYAPAGAALTESLLGARVLIVTQRPETRGLLWPSKLATVARLPRPVLWVGPTEGAIARWLGARSASAAGVFAPGDGEAVAGWIEGQFRVGGEGASGERASDPSAPDVESTAESGGQVWEGWLQTLARD